MAAQQDFDFQIGELIRLRGEGWFGLAALVLVLVAAMAVLVFSYR